MGVKKMTQITIEEAASRLRREILSVKGVVGVSYIGNTIIVYVESSEIALQIPKAYYGYTVVTKITGPIVTLR
jgi:hypothetical protein